MTKWTRPEKKKLTRPPPPPTLPSFILAKTLFPPVPSSILNLDWWLLWMTSYSYYEGWLLQMMTYTCTASITTLRFLTEDGGLTRCLLSTLTLLLSIYRSSSSMNENQSINDLSLLLSLFFLFFVRRPLLANSERGHSHRACWVLLSIFNLGAPHETTINQPISIMAIIISIHDEALSIQLFSFYYLHQMFFFVPVLVTIHEVLRRLWLVYKDVVT